MRFGSDPHMIRYPTLRSSMPVRDSLNTLLRCVNHLSSITPTLSETIPKLQLDFWAIGEMLSPLF